MLSRSLLVAASLFALEATAFWRLPCDDRLVLERIDPIDSPNKFASHVHTVHGGKNFHKDSTNNDLRESECTSCAVRQDLSAYWTPNMYWEDADTGELTALNQTGGMLVYYLQRHHETDIPTPEGDLLHIFPEDFRMIAGDARQRNFTWREEMGTLDNGNFIFDDKSIWSDADRQNEAMKRQDAIGFNCLNYQAPAEGALERKGLPTDYNCPDGLRAEVFFPSCWNGKDSDSPDHRDHVRYPTLVQDGECPDGFKHRLPSLFFETIWDIDYAQGRNGRLVLSDGDPTGYGYHGDFMNGWDQNILRQAVNECTDPSGLVGNCAIFDLQSREEQVQCKKTDIEVDEEVWGPLQMLPGCNEITEEGPYAPMSEGCPSDGENSDSPSDGEEEEKPEEEQPEEEQPEEEQPEEEQPEEEQPEEEQPEEEQPEEEQPEEEQPEENQEEPESNEGENEAGSDSEDAPEEVVPPAPAQELAPEQPSDAAAAPPPAQEIAAPPAENANEDPFLVVVTVTQFHHEDVVTQVVQAPDVTEIVTADAVIETVVAKRNTHRRRHAHGHKH